jgi:UDP-N-acetylmuramoyl-tripeptide--D-alanyl-D-alanine ligase
MEPLKLNEILMATAGDLLRGKDAVIPGVAIDSRTVKPGELYIAIRGKRLDGHKFTQAAVDAGAVGVVIDDKTALPKKCIGIRVENTTEALGRIAGYYRSKVQARVVAVTGSNGKTTTKEMLYAVLSRRFRTLKPEGSFNNDIGVPLTVLNMNSQTQAAIFEIEMNELGGTARLAGICRPLVGVVTNIGDTHLEFMKDRRGVAREKAELLEALPPAGTAVLNSDDTLVTEIGLKYAKCSVVTFGCESRADVFASGVTDLGLAGTRFMLQGELRVDLPVPGIHNVGNCLAACGAAHALGVEFEAMPEALRAFQPPPMRLRVLRFGSTTLIEDCYNANPQSMRAALDVMCHDSVPEQRIAFLGDMLELGEQSAGQHEALGRDVGRFVNRLVLVGPMGEFVERGARQAGLSRIHRYETSAQARDALFDFVREGDTILVKGSRAMAMELVSQEITTHYGKESQSETRR